MKAEKKIRRANGWNPQMIQIPMLELKDLKQTSSQDTRGILRYHNKTSQTSSRRKSIRERGRGEVGCFTWSNQSKDSGSLIKNNSRRREWAAAFIEWQKNEIGRAKTSVAKMLLTSKYKTKMFSNLKTKSIYD